MHILVLNYEYPPLGGGAGVVTRELSREFAAAGHRVTVITSGFPGLSDQENLNGVEIIRVTACRRYLEKSSVPQMACYLKSAWDFLQQWLKTEKPDIMHSHFLLPVGRLAHRLHRKYQIPYLVTLHGGDVPSAAQTRWHKLFAIPARKIARDAQALISVSESLRDLAVTDFGKYQSNISCIGNGIRIPEKIADPPPGQRNLFFAGRVTRQKNLPFLLQALRGIEGEWHLTIAGDGPGLSEVKKKIKEYQFSSKITCTGWIDETQVLEHLGRSHFFVLPSLGEGMSIAVLQAFSMGVPVVATDVTGLRDLVQENKTGYLVKPGDQNGFRNLLQQLVTGDVNRNMGKICREYVAQHHNWEEPAQAYLRLMENIG
jgi:glycosyltransferase involved in cell wall biosynthesis